MTVYALDRAATVIGKSSAEPKKKRDLGVGGTIILSVTMRGVSIDD
jgi:hypothetical protein